MRPARLLALAAAVAVTGGALAASPALTDGGAGAATTDPLAVAIAASAAPGHHWSDPGPIYGVASQQEVPIRMADGTILRATVDTPTDLATGKSAAGRFPVLLTQSPYGRNVIGIDPWFVQRGYIDVAVDVRGTGSSGGTFSLFDPQQVRDSVAVVNWAAKLPHSSGKVGLHGASYLGITQLLTAGAVGPNSPVKAIFPIVSANEVYRDTAFMGGIPGGEFDVAYLGGLLPAVNLLNPVVGLLQDPTDLQSRLQVLLQHAQNTGDYNAAFLLKTYLGGPDSFDTQTWKQQSPTTVLDKVVANHIPAYLVGGEYDLFQRGEPLNYAGLQNAWAGRSSTAPMTATQPVTGRYQLLDGPYTHLVGSTDPGLQPLELEWFDTWLKGKDTGMATTRTPLHYYDLGRKAYANTTAYPLVGARPTTMYLSGARSGSGAFSTNDGSLSTTAPTAATGSDTEAWAPVGSSICDRSSDQWIMGAFTLVLDNLALPTPCFQDDRPGQVGPTALTYTTPAFTRARTLAGPIAATIYATATTAETEWVVNVEDVAPDGTSKPLTQGALLGSLRSVDASRSWTVGGKTVLPYHPYTAASARPVVPGAVTRYDVEVFPTYATIAPGHRIRITLNTTDFPHLMPTPAQLQRLAGGVYQVQRTASHPSSVTLPLIG